MTISTIFIFLLLGFLLLVVLSRFRQGSSNSTGDVPPTGDDIVYHVHHLAPGASHPPQSQGEVGGRDMSGQPHGSDHGGDSGGGTDGAGS